jgi:bifunctional enzyme CysN/CysC
MRDAPQTARPSLMRVVLAGHVDHGKSTLVGRLLHATDSLPDGKLETVAKVSSRRGRAFEWAFVTDALQAERDQGVTIDASHIRLRQPGGDIVLVDAPGHREFIRNMITGAATSDAAVLVIDALEGAQEQSYRHGFLLDFVGIRQLVIVVNKMDLVDFDQARFEAVRGALEGYLGGLDIRATAIVPVSARDGDNVAAPSERMPWYRGPSVLEALRSFRAPAEPLDLPLRLPIQAVYKFDERRILAGTVLSGRLAVGDRLLFSPSNKTATVKSIEAWHASAPPRAAVAGQPVGITLDLPIFIERGELASHVERAPAETTSFRARLFWLSATPLRAGQDFTLYHLTARIPVTVQTIERVCDPGASDGLSASAGVHDTVAQDSIVDVVIRARDLIALDAYADHRSTGRFALVDRDRVVAGGLVSLKGFVDQRPVATPKSAHIYQSRAHVSPAMRAARNGHSGAVIWLTGLSGAGKSTIAHEAERRLFERGYQVYVLDGDNVRTTLNADLGFSPEDRSENVRRLGAAASLFAEAGFIAIVAAISPYAGDRERARAAARAPFHEIWVKADVAVCEQRDPKGLYKLARAGEIKNFTGVAAPYEPPPTADLVIDTTDQPVEESVAALLGYVTTTAVGRSWCEEANG